MSNKKLKTNRYNPNEFRTIIPLMKTNPFEAKNKCEEYLKKYPKDYMAYTYYASVLITVGQFNEADQVLEYSESTFRKNGYYASNENKLKNIIANKIRILSYQERYEELYQLCTQYYQELLMMNFGAIHFYARKKTGRLQQELREINSYLFKQITEYQESDFLEHVKKHLSEYNKDLEEPNSNLFTPNINITELVEEVKKHLLSDNRIFPDFFVDTYIFKYDNCGTEDNKTVNFFKVICFHNTKDIITMCPVAENLNIPYIDLNYLNQNINQEPSNPKVKRLSQIDKFNQRYKHN